jgi:hypothetical protein
MRRPIRWRATAHQVPRLGPRMESGSIFQPVFPPNHALSSWRPRPAARKGGSSTLRPEHTVTGALPSLRMAGSGLRSHFRGL